MSRLGILVAGAALLVGTSASAAGIIGPITTQPSSSSVIGIDLAPGTTFGGTATSGRGAIGDGGQYAHYQTEVNVSPTQVEFKSANTTTGYFVGAASTTTVGFTFDTGQSAQSQTTVKLDSTIIAASMGFQVIGQPGFDADCQFNACDPIATGNFANLVPASGSGTLGQVGFIFDISDNGSSIYNLQGQYILGYADGVLTTDSSSLFGPGSASQRLFGFTSTGNGVNQLGFSWGETGILLDLIGPTHDLKYTTSVYSFTNTDCRYNSGGNCLVAYSGFGDPIGRAGAIEEALAVNSAIPGGAVFNMPTFDGDTLTFKSVNPQTGGVPEPATWAMMIMGFGGIGATLRRRRMAAIRA